MNQIIENSIKPRYDIVKHKCLICGNLLMTHKYKKEDFDSMIFRNKFRHSNTVHHSCRKELRAKINRQKGLERNRQLRKFGKYKKTKTEIMEIMTQ
jgi:hypothetical protein